MERSARPSGSLRGPLSLGRRRSRRSRARPDLAPGRDSDRCRSGWLPAAREPSAPHRRHGPVGLHRLASRANPLRQRPRPPELAAPMASYRAPWRAGTASRPAASTGCPAPRQGLQPPDDAPRVTCAAGRAGAPRVTHRVASAQKAQAASGGQQLAPGGPISRIGTHPPIAGPYTVPLGVANIGMSGGRARPTNTTGSAKGNEAAHAHRAAQPCTRQQIFSTCPTSHCRIVTRQTGGDILREEPLRIEQKHNRYGF